MAIFKKFDTYPYFHKSTFAWANYGFNYAHFNSFYIPGDMTVNSAFFQLWLTGASSNASGSMNLSLGLFTLNGSTLTQINSGSLSTSYAGSTSAYGSVSLSFSASQILSRGIYWACFGLNVTTSGSFVGFYMRANGIYRRDTNNPPVGPFFRGLNSNGTTSVFPASLATSDGAKDGGTVYTFTQMPYILLA